MTLDDCEKIFDRALASQSEAEFCHVIAPLFNHYPIMSLDVGRSVIYWRARIIDNDVYSNLSELDYPPSPFARQGRLNDAGVSCFYVSMRRETAIAEVHAKPGQRVQLAGFRILREAPIRLAVVGEYAHVQKTGYMRFAGADPGMSIARILNATPRHDALRQIYIDKFLAHVLADPSAHEHGYRFSRALGQFIYARNTARGIAFPSVRDEGGFNVAVQAAASDASFHNVCCLVVEVERRGRFGVIDFNVLRSADGIDDNLNFIWNTDGNPTRIGMYNMDREDFEHAAANPNDPNALLNILHGQRGSTHGGLAPSPTKDDQNDNT